MLFRDFVARFQSFARKTFPAYDRTQGILEHIRRELDEVAKAPDDIEEWCDIIFLALDGARNNGATPDDIVEHLQMKMVKLEMRKWPDPANFSPDVPFEHVRS